MKRSYTSSRAWAGRASPRSILLMPTMGESRASSAFFRTNGVCGSGPSAASTRSSTPSTSVSVRSTSEPKSAWPGVSTMLTWTPRYAMAVFLAMIVMPFSRSRSIESMIRSGTDSFARKRPDCQSMASTRVVLPWSTWAMIAMFRMFSRCCILPSYHAGVRRELRVIVRSAHGPASLPEMRTAARATLSPRGTRRPRAERGLRLSLPLPGLRAEVPGAPMGQTLHEAAGAGSRDRAHRRTRAARRLGRGRARRRRNHRPLAPGMHGLDARATARGRDGAPRAPARARGAAGGRRGGPGPVGALGQGRHRLRRGQSGRGAQDPPHPDEPPPRRARRGGARGAADPGRTARGPPDARFLADDAPPGSGDPRPDGVRSLVLAMRVGRELLSIMTPARARGGPPTVAAGSRPPLLMRRPG